MGHYQWVEKTPLDHNLHSYMYMLARFSFYPIIQERMTRIELAIPTWKDGVLPLHYTLMKWRDGGESNPRCRSDSAIS